jgi:hypothetical protein
VWSKIFAAVDATSGRDPRSVADALGRLSRPSVIARAARLGGRSAQDDFGQLAATLADVYAGLKQVTGCEVVVDTSKPPTYGWLLGSVGSVDLYTVHLVRDPRAVAYSWQRQKLARDLPEGGLMARKGAAASGVHWTVWNEVAERLGRNRPDRYLRLRYEDLVADPGQALQRVLALVGNLAERAPHAVSHSAELGTNHAVAGNPSRFDRGRVAIELDSQWTDQLSARDRSVVTLLTSPIRRRYGYPRRTAPPSGSSTVTDESASAEIA